MNEVDQWCIDQEYVGIENTVERNIKIFHDYKHSHSYDDYVKLVKDEHAEIADVRSIVLVDDFLNSLTKVYHNGTMIGKIVPENDNLKFMSYEGIGDDQYPVERTLLPSESEEETVLRTYQEFDKYVIDGEYLLDTSGSDTIDKLYLRMVRDHHGLFKKF